MRESEILNQSALLEALDIKHYVVLWVLVVKYMLYFNKSVRQHFSPPTNVANLNSLNIRIAYFLWWKQTTVKDVVFYFVLHSFYLVSEISQLSKNYIKPLVDAIPVLHFVDVPGHSLLNTKMCLAKMSIKNHETCE